jgi:glutathione S-transferase
MVEIHHQQGTLTESDDGSTNQAILYSFRRCPYAIRARLALAAASVKVELREVCLAAKPPELLSASAKGTVPVLVLADGRVIDESLQIVRWCLEQLGRDWPGDRLADQLIASCDGEFKALLDHCRYPNRHANGDAAAARQQALTLLRQWNQELLEVPQTSQRPELQWLILPFVRQFRGLDAESFEQESGLEALRAWLDSWLEGPALQSVMASPWAERRAWHSPSWLYHLTLTQDWHQAKRQGFYPWSTRDRTFAQVGFVHASWRHQVAATYQRFYADAAAVVLLALDPRAIANAGVPIRQEPAPDTGELFPHLYGPLPLGAVVLADPYPGDACGDP